jgi:hypothetical protein
VFLLETHIQFAMDLSRAVNYPATQCPEVSDNVPCETPTLSSIFGESTCTVCNEIYLLALPVPPTVSSVGASQAGDSIWKVCHSMFSGSNTDTIDVEHSPAKEDRGILGKRWNMSSNSQVRGPGARETLSIHAQIRLLSECCWI